MTDVQRSVTWPTVLTAIAIPCGRMVAILIKLGLAANSDDDRSSRSSWPR